MALCTRNHCGHEDVEHFDDEKSGTCAARYEPLDPHTGLPIDDRGLIGCDCPKFKP